MYPYQNPQLSVEERVADLLSRMSLREKIGQLTQRLYGFTSFVRQGDEVVFTDEFKDEVDYYSGWVLCTVCTGRIPGLPRPLKPAWTVSCPP